MVLFDILMVLLKMLDNYFFKTMKNEAKEQEEEDGLVKLPDLVLRKVTKELDFQSVQNIRATCKTLRNCAPYPCDKLTAINIKLEQKFTAVVFRTTDKRYVMKVPQRQNTWESLLLFDWDLIFHERNTPLKNFSIEYNKYFYDPQFSFLYKFFRLILKSHHPLLVQSIHLDVSNQDDVLSILQFCDPKHLQFISLNGDIKEMLYEEKVFPLDKLYHLEQWKNAKEFELWDVRDFTRNNLNPDSAPFAHFSYLYIEWSDVQEPRGRRSEWKHPAELSENLVELARIVAEIRRRLNQ